MHAANACRCTPAGWDADTSTHPPTPGIFHALGSSELAAALSSEGESLQASTTAIGSATKACKTHKHTLPDTRPSTQAHYLAPLLLKQVLGLTTSCFHAPLNCSGKMDAAVRRTLDDFLPPKAAERCNDSTVVTVTLLDPSGGKLQNTTVQRFTDRRCC